MEKKLVSVQCADVYSRENKGKLIITNFYDNTGCLKNFIYNKGAKQRQVFIDKQGCLKEDKIIGKIK